LRAAADARQRARRAIDAHSENSAWLTKRRFCGLRHWRGHIAPAP
jgi:hypothetical protein